MGAYTLAEDIFVSNSTIWWLYDNVKLTIAWDFAGYLISIKKDILIGIDLSGTIFIIPLNRKGIIKQKRMDSIVKALLKSNFLIRECDEPFPGFEIHTNLPYKKSNYNNVAFYNGFIINRENR